MVFIGLPACFASLLLVVKGAREATNHHLDYVDNDWYFHETGITQLFQARFLLFRSTANKTVLFNTRTYWATPNYGHCTRASLTDLYDLLYARYRVLNPISNLENITQIWRLCRYDNFKIWKWRLRTGLRVFLTDMSNQVTAEAKWSQKNRRIMRFL